MVRSPGPLSPPLSPIRPLQIATKRSKSATAAASTTVTVAHVPAPQRATVSHSPTVLRGMHAPSPLSLAQNNTVPPPVRSPPLRASSNPLPAELPSPAGDVAAGSHLEARRSLSIDLTSDQAGDGGGSGDAGAQDPLESGSASTDIPQGSPASLTQSPLASLPETLALRTTPPSSPKSATVVPPPPSSPRVIRHSRSAMLPSRASDLMSSPRRNRTSSQSQSRPSVDTVNSVSTIRSEDISPRVASPLSVADESLEGTQALRISKRGMSRPPGAPLRLVTSHQSLQSISSPTFSMSTSEHTGEQDKVHVQDTEFELVKPNVPFSPFNGSFESLPSPSRPDGSFLRTDSPALSTFSGSSHRMASGDVSPALSELKTPKEFDATTVEAHRQREQRWVTAITSIPPSQARKSKKIRKMVLDGVPASVRYQVWALLMDSKARRMDGLYQKLAGREKVAAYAEIERVIQTAFTATPQLQDGSLANVLQAYLTMVPDIKYSRGMFLLRRYCTVELRSDLIIYRACDDCCAVASAVARRRCVLDVHLCHGRASSAVLLQRERATRS